MDTNLSELYSQLTTAIESAKKANEALESAKAKLSPLEEAAKEKDAAVNNLMIQIQSQTGHKAGRRRSADGTKRTYTPMTPENKILAVEKRYYTKAINAGKSEAEAKKIGKEAGKKSAAKLGLSK